MRKLALLLAALVAGAQSPEEPTIRVTVANVLLDVIVTDRKGNPVTDLKPSDFRVSQDNKPRPVVSANRVDLPRRAAIPAAANQPPPARSTTATPPATSTQRTIALVVDDLGLSVQSLALVRDGIRRFIEKQLQPTDRVAIIRTGGNIGALQQFTSDPALLRVAASRLRFNPRSRAHVEQGLKTDPDDLKAAIERADDQGKENALVGALGTLNIVTAGLANAPGRKSVILFTDSLPVLERRRESSPLGEELTDYGPNPRVFAAIRKLTDSASRNAVVIHTVDAKGLLSYGLDMTENAAAVRYPVIINGARQTRDLRIQNALDGLKFVAQQTGGTFTTNNNDMNDALLKSVNSDASYYLLAYQPDPAIFDAPAEVFHRLKVTVTRPGLEVRYRPGFFGRVDTRESLAQLAQPDPALNFTLSPGYFQTPEGAVIDTQIFIDAADLTFTPEPDGLHKMVVETNLVTLNEQGLPENQLGQDYTMRVKADQLAELRKNGLVYRVRHPVKKPGSFLMKAVITDKATRHSGTATQFIEVPDIRKKNLVLSNLTIGRDAESANRIFHPGDTLDYGAQIINHPGAGLKREVRLYCEGDQVGHFPATAFEPITVPNVTYPVAAGRLQLGPQATPGNYTLELVVTDPNRKGEKSRAIQHTTFTVSPR